MVQWLIHLQGTQIRSLVWEDSTCQGATKPMSQLLSLEPQGPCSITREDTAVRSPYTTTRKSICSDKDPGHPKIKQIRKKKKIPGAASHSILPSRQLSSIYLNASQDEALSTSPRSGFHDPKACLMEKGKVQWVQVRSQRMTGFGLVSGSEAIRAHQLWDGILREAKHSKFFKS